MTIYTVLAPPPPAGSAEADPLDYVFVKDGFNWPCVVSPELWMIFRRLWLVLIAFVVAVVAVLLLARATQSPLPGIFLALAHFFFALEANNLRVWTLLRRDYRMVGVAEGRNIEDAEIRFFHAREEPPRRDPRLPPPARLQSAMGIPAMRGPSAESGEVVGLFPAPGRAQ